MRKRLFEIIEAALPDDKLSYAYDAFMMVTIIVSIAPMAFKGSCTAFWYIEQITAAIFIIDYICRLATADLKLPGKGAAAFFLYPFTPMAIIDLISILPSLTLLNSSFRLLRLFRLFRALRILKFLRYSKSFVIITAVLKKERDELAAVATLAIAYIIISALVIFNVEPDSFSTFLDAVYWATMSLTTVGYGDICPITSIGRFVTMLSSILGIAIIALPSGIITAGYINELKRIEEDEKASAQQL